MIVRAVISPKRRDFAIAVVVSCSSACTSMLGIDGDYAAGATDRDTGLASGGQETGSGGLRPAVPAPTGGKTGGGGEPGSGGAAAQGAGGTRPVQGNSSGGAQPAGGNVGAGGSVGVGGTPGAGGVLPSSGGSKGTETGGAGTGGAPPDVVDAGVVPSCPIGIFTGSYRGTHKPGTPLSVLSAPISGDLALRFSGTGTGSATVTGSLFDPFVDTTGGVTAPTIRGTVDCAKGTGTLTIIAPAEVTTLVPLVYTKEIEGTIDIKVGQSGMLSGSFSIRETENSAGTGSGNWSASK